MLGDVAMNIMIIKTNTDDMDERKYDGNNWWIHGDYVDRMLMWIIMD